MFRIELTDLDGTRIGHVFRWESASVDIPINDARTAKLTLPYFEDICAEIRPLDRMLKMFWRDEIVFRGVVLTPVWSGNGRNLEVNAHDPTIWWKRNFHRYGDAVVEDGYLPDGLGLRALAESAIPSIAQLGRGVRHPGILWGTDTVPELDPEEYEIVKVQRGTNVFESIQNLSSGVGTPEWRVVPLDNETDFYAVLDTSLEFGVDRTTEVIFHYAFGRRSLEDLTLTEGGDEVRNYAVVVNPGGEEDADDVDNRALSHRESSWLQYGIYENWESSGEEDPKDLLQKKANAWVKAYSQPPNFIGAVLAKEGAVNGETVYHYPSDFGLGDSVRVVGRFGAKTVDDDYRIEKVTLSQDRQGPRTAIEAVPNLNPTLSEEDPAP